MQYRREIDGLRALAIMPVLFFHAGFSSFSGGFVGVDVFFVISGYLISSLCIEELEKGKFSILSFYERRARRLLPPLFLVLGFSIFFSWIWFLPEELMSFHKSLFSALFFVSNIFFWQTSDYFAVSNMPLLHTWSLAVEEQFYLIFPLFLILFWNLGIRVIFAVASVVLLLSFFLSDWASYTYPVANFYLLPTRGWELLVGVLVSFFLLNRNKDFILNRNLDDLLSFIGLCLILFSITSFDSSTPFPGRYALYPVIGTALVVIFSSKKTRVGWFLGLKPLVGIGLLSYSLYLWHYPLFSFAEIRNLKELSDNLYLYLILISFVLSYISWKYIESPFRDRRYNFKNNLFYKLSSVSFFILIITFASFNGKSPYSSTSDKNLEKILADLSWPTDLKLDKDCQEIFGANQYCLIHDINQEPTDALIGDSHANHFYPGLSHYLSLQGRNLLMQGGGGCAPFFGTDRGVDRGGNIRFKCYEHLKEPFNNILNSSSIDRVFIAFHHYAYFEDSVNFIDKEGLIKEDSNFKNSLKALLRTVQRLENKDKEVILIYDLPELDMNLDFFSCIRSIYIFNHENSCLNKAFKFNAIKYDEMLKELQTETNIKIFYTHPFLDNFPIKEGDLLYREETHLSLKGSLYLSTFYDF